MRTIVVAGSLPQGARPLPDLPMPVTVVLSVGLDGSGSMARNIRGRLPPHHSRSATLTLSLKTGMIQDLQSPPELLSL